MVVAAAAPPLLWSVFFAEANVSIEVIGSGATCPHGCIPVTVHLTIKTRYIACLGASLRYQTCIAFY